MIRKIQITMAPSAALVALTVLHTAPDDTPSLVGQSSATATFGARFGHEVARAFEAHGRALDALGQCLEWLERRALCRVERARTRASIREPSWRYRCELRVDVRALAREVTAEAQDPDSKAHTNAWALRTVLRHLATTRLHTCELRAGTERMPATEALAAFDVAMSAAGFGPYAAAPPRWAHLATKARRRDDDEVQPAVEATPPPVAEPTPPPAAKTAPGTKTAPAAKRRREAPKPPTGFGGLPEDAVSEDRRPGEVYSARGLTNDAEFFLAEAMITTWPCDAAMLERARRQVVARLHPDRAGEASTSAFHRAIKGHAELLAKLPVAPPVTAPTVAPEPVAAATPAPAPVTRPRRARAPKKPTETPPAVQPATATTHEWPPRAAA